MAKDNANNFRTQIEDTAGSGTYSDVAYLTTDGLTLNRSGIDVNNKTDGQAQCIISGGMANWDGTFEGIANDHASLLKLLDINAGNGLDSGNSWRFRHNWVASDGVTSRGTFTGIYFLENMEFSGEVHGALTFTATLRSSGNIVWTPA